MPMQYIFWGIMILCVIFGGWRGYNDPPNRPYYGMGLVVFVLVGLLGWKTFGPAVQ